MNKIEEFKMVLKYGTPARAIEELIEKVNDHRDIHFQAKGLDHDDYDRWIVSGVIRVPTMKGYVLPSEDDSCAVFEKLIYKVTGVYPSYADYQDPHEVFYHFEMPANFELGWGFTQWVNGLEDILRAADMQYEIEEQAYILLKEQ